MNVAVPAPAPVSTEPPAAEAAPPPKPPLAPLLRAKTVETLVATFAALRTYEKTAVTKTIAWLTAVDAKVTQALVVGEEFLVTKLRAG